MKLSDVKNFSLEADIHPTGGVNVQLFVLDSIKVDAGAQRSLDSISLIGEGKDEEAATKAATDFALETLEKLRPHSEIVRVGVRELTNDGKLFKAKVQLGLFEKADENTDLIKKKGFGFGVDKDMKKAQEKAIESALRLVGEK